MATQIMGEMGIAAVIWVVICGFLTYWFFKGSHGVFIQTSGGDSELIMSRAQTGEVKKFAQEINNAIAENC